jgi:hypothetical protein
MLHIEPSERRTVRCPREGCKHTMSTGRALRDDPAMRAPKISKLRKKKIESPVSLRQVGQLNTPLCSISGCHRPRVARSWCHTHYKRWQVHGNPHVVIERARKECMLPDCTRLSHGNGLCRVHRARQRKGADLTAPIQARYSLGLNECILPDCAKPVMARNLCQMHYARFIKYGDTETVLKERYTDGSKCAVADCTKLPTARNLCPMHYRRLRLYGDHSARSPKYSNIQCLHCGKMLSVPPGQIGLPRMYCSAWCQNQRTIQRRGRRYYDPRVIEGVPREFVFNRDNWICQLCSEPVDRSLTYPDLMSASIDHIKFVKDGGLHTLHNVRLAHYICNVRRGARY